MTKVTLHFANGHREVVQLEPGPTSPPGTDLFQELALTWHHALDCDREKHLMQLKRLDGSRLIIDPLAIVYLDDRAETLQ